MARRLLSGSGGQEEGLVRGAQKGLSGQAEGEESGSLYTEMRGGKSDLQVWLHERG